MFFRKNTLLNPNNFLINENSNICTKSPRCVKLPFLFVYLLPVLVMVAKFLRSALFTTSAVKAPDRDLNCSFIRDCTS